MGPVQTRIDSETVDAWIGIFKTQKLALNEVERRLKSAGLPPLIWYDVLWELKRTGHALRPKQIERQLLLSQYNLSRLLRRMEKLHLVTKTADPDDGRGWLINLTKNGLQVQEKMWPVYATAIRSIIADSLNIRESKMLADLLDRILRNATGIKKPGRIKKGANGAPVDRQ